MVNQPVYLPMVIKQPKKKKRSFNLKRFIKLYREPIVTYCITPNNAPDLNSFNEQRPKRSIPNRVPTSANQWEDMYASSEKSDMLLNTINGLFARFYAPERVRLLPNGIKVKMNDCVAYKVVVQGGQMKFYLTVPKKWSKGFVSAIKKDWGSSGYY